MNALVSQIVIRPYGRMKTPIPTASEEARIWGQAVKILREKAGMSQEEAAENAGMRQQVWQPNETGKRNGLLKTTTQRKMAEAVGATHAELIKLARDLGLPTADIAEQRGNRSNPYEFPLDGRVRASRFGFQMYDDGADDRTFDLSNFLGDDTRILTLAGESMVPYAEPGGFVTYKLNSYPQRGKGVVIRMKDGTFYVKKYTGMDSEFVHCIELSPISHEGKTGYFETPVQFPKSEIDAIYAVGVRGD